MTINKFHFNEHKQYTWKCDWLTCHIISINIKSKSTFLDNFEQFPLILFPTIMMVVNMQLHMKLYVYLCKLSHKIFHSYACYHVLSVHLSFYENLSYNLKMHYFRDNYGQLRE